MKLVKVFATRGRARSPFNQPALFSAGPDATEVGKPAPLTVSHGRPSNLAFHVELETSTLTKIIRSVPRALRDDYGYDGALAQRIGFCTYREVSMATRFRCRCAISCRKAAGTRETGLQPKFNQGEQHADNNEEPWGDDAGRGAAGRHMPVR